MQVEREASMPVTLTDVPSGRCQRRVPAKLMDMLPTSLRGLPHLRLKPGLPVSHRRGEVTGPTVPSHTSVSTSTPPRPRATVEDVPDIDMEDVQAYPPPLGMSAPDPPPAPAPAPAHPPIDTHPNRYGVFRRYTTAPSSDPEEGLTLDAFAEASTHLCAPPDPHEHNPLRLFGSTAHAWIARA